jgi:hypothetical protein
LQGRVPMSSRSYSGSSARTSARVIGIARIRTTTREISNGMIGKRPAFIVRCVGAARLSGCHAKFRHEGYGKDGSEFD